MLLDRVHVYARFNNFLVNCNLVRINVITY